MRWRPPKRPRGPAPKAQFWEMHRWLYAGQRRLDSAALVARARALGLDVERFVAELRGGLHGAKMQADFLSGVRSGVNGTPTFFINGRRHDGPADLPSLMRALQGASRGGATSP